ncbi:TIGR01457 family HAD-type hydrolase, partial [Bacillus thuringiensis]
IRRGATFIGTNADMNLPAEDELIPGNGSQCAFVAAASGVEPLYIGKPESIIVNMALEKMGYSKRDALIVGDNYDTDIKAGFNSDVDQLLTLTGITQKEDLQNKRQPTVLVNSLDEFEL